MGTYINIGNKAFLSARNGESVDKSELISVIGQTLKLFSAFMLLSLLFTACHQDYEHKTVLCIPVYGQSLALGEEAERITDFDSLACYADGRIVNENLDHQFGYFDNNDTKQWLKKMTGYTNRAFELSIYNMAEVLADATGSDTLICIFPGGQGATAIANLSKGTAPYQKFMEDIETAYHEATEKGWDFLIPAICWMQGESDIVDYPATDYKQMLTKIWKDMNTDIHQLTGRQDSIRFICYQANSLSRAEHFNASSFQCKETTVPQTFVELLKDDNRFWASGPTYPYTCVGEKIHIDARGQQAIGRLAARSVMGILKGSERYRGLIPTAVNTDGNTVIVQFDTKGVPLTLDTIQVRKAENYGFSIINKENKNILSAIAIDTSTVRMTCLEPPIGSQVRYAVNGDYMKSGNLHGPRGNLRDSAGNWCYQFDMPCR